MESILTRQKHKTEPEDAALFRAAVGEVQSLPDQNRINPHQTPRKPLQRARMSLPEIADTLSDGCHADHSADLAAESTPDEFMRNGLSRMTLRKLRRGTWPVQDSIDLHGSSGDVARKLLQAFLHQAAQRGLRCVLVIHGKGMNSQGGEAILRKLTRHWLPQRPDVLAYCNAQPRDGGSGATLVLLKVAGP